MAGTLYGDVSWERMIGAVDKVRERLLRATGALDAAVVPYAVIGGNAVAAWVSRIDEAAVRNTREVDLLLRRADLAAAATALASSASSTASPRESICSSMARLARHATPSMSFSPARRSAPSTWPPRPTSPRSRR